MYWIDDTLTISGSSPPTPSTAANAIGWFTEGNSITGTVPTPVHADWLNAVQAEGLNLLAAVGITAVKTTFTQWVQSIRRLAGANTFATSANATLTADNSGLVIVNATSGNLTLTLPAAAASGGSPLKYRIRRADLTANTVTVNLNGSDTWAPGAITGSLVLQQSEGADIFGDGVSTWFMAPVGIGYRGITKLTSSATYVVPVACTTVEVELWAGGSGSWASASGIPGGGGSGGGYSRRLIAGLTPGSSITATVGAAGAAGTTSVAPTVGGSSNFGSYCSATGGQLNAVNVSSGVSNAPFGNPGGTGTGGDLNLTGGDGGNGAGASLTGGFGGDGPMSGGTNSVANGSGRAGYFPGGGGSGAGTGSGGTTAQNGAAGAGGYIIIRAF